MHTDLFGSPETSHRGWRLMLLVSFMNRCLTCSCCKLSSGDWKTSNKKPVSQRNTRGFCFCISWSFFQWWLFVNHRCCCVSMMKVMTQWDCTNSDRPHELMWPFKPGFCVMCESDHPVKSDVQIKHSVVESWFPCHWKTCECQRVLKSWFPGSDKSTLLVNKIIRNTLTD